MEIKHITDQFKIKVKERKSFLAAIFFQDILELAKKSISFGSFFLYFLRFIE